MVGVGDGKFLLFSLFSGFFGSFFNEEIMCIWKFFNFWVCSIFWIVSFFYFLLFMDSVRR